jgi:hypothetical protein
VLVLLLWLNAVDRQSTLLAFLTGASTYASLYLSFSLLPLLPLPVLWLVIDTWLNREKRSYQRAAGLLAAFAGGLLLGFLFFRLALNYDPYIRYTAAMAQHLRAKEFTPGWYELLQAVYLNNAEFFTWMGWPMAILFLASAVRSAWRWLHGQASRLDGLFLAFAATYLALNFFGQTRGEVQRLWLFMLPMICLFAARETRSLFRRPALAISFVITLQLVTALFTLWFQDFYG